MQVADVAVLNQSVDSTYLHVIWLIRMWHDMIVCMGMLVNLKKNLQVADPVALTQSLDLTDQIKRKIGGCVCVYICIAKMTHVWKVTWLSNAK